MMDKETTGISRRALLRSTGAVLGGGIAAQTLPWSGHGSQAAWAQTSAVGEQLEHVSNKPLRISARYYQHHDADFSLDVPEEAFGGWKKTELEFSREHTAVVVMHAWDYGTLEQFPGWWRAVSEAPRAQAVVRKVFPPLLRAVRASDLPLFHVVAKGDYYKQFPGHKYAVALAGPTPPGVQKVKSDPIMDKLREFRRNKAYPGTHNIADIERGQLFKHFPDEALPVGEEAIAEDRYQLFALCKEYGINHLVYFGFCTNWCMLLSPGGMAQMGRHGLMCSVIRQATTAVENKETARKELCKEIALWRIALAFGFVFDVDDFIAGIKT